MSSRPESKRLPALVEGQPDLLVPLASALKACIVTPADESPDALGEALLASERKAMRLERPLATESPWIYDALLGFHLPARFDTPADRGPAGAQVDGTCARGLYFVYLHFTEWALIGEIGASAGRSVAEYAFTNARGYSRIFLDGSCPLGPEIHLPHGQPALIGLGPLLVERRRLLREALAAALDGPQTVWVLGCTGSVYLRDGAGRDVGEDLERADEAREAWAAVFDCLRRTYGDDAMTLPSSIPAPVRQEPGYGTCFPVGRLCWPHPEAPWLEWDGVSLPERVLALFELRRSA